MIVSDLLLGKLKGVTFVLRSEMTKGKWDSSVQTKKEGRLCFGFQLPTSVELSCSGSDETFRKEGSPSKNQII